MGCSEDSHIMMILQMHLLPVLDKAAVEKKMKADVISALCHLLTLKKFL